MTTWTPTAEATPPPFVDVRIRLNRGHGIEDVVGYYSSTLDCWAVGVGLHHKKHATHWQPLADDPCTTCTTPPAIRGAHVCAECPTWKGVLR